MYYVIETSRLLFFLFFIFFLITIVLSKKKEGLRWANHQHTEHAWHNSLPEAQPERKRDM